MPPVYLGFIYLCIYNVTVKVRLYKCINFSRFSIKETKLYVIPVPEIKLGTYKFW